MMRGSPVCRHLSCCPTCFVDLSLMVYVVELRARTLPMLYSRYQLFLHQIYTPARDRYVVQPPDVEQSKCSKPQWLSSCQVPSSGVQDGDSRIALRELFCIVLRFLSPVNNRYRPDLSDKMSRSQSEVNQESTRHPNNKERRERMYSAVPRLRHGAQPQPRERVVSHFTVRQ